MNVDFYTEIAESKAHRKCRDAIKNFVFNHPDYLKDLVEIALMTKDKNHHKACWVLELICEEQLVLFIPYIDQFCNKLADYTSDSAIRSVSKICLFLSKSKTIKLTTFQEEKIIETNLDWLISTKKAANAAYSMRSIFEFGKKYSWVNEELKILLSRDLSQQTAGYCFVAKDILKRLK